MNAKSKIAEKFGLGELKISGVLEVAQRNEIYNLIKLAFEEGIHSKEENVKVIYDDKRDDHKWKDVR